ncbi:MAG TPA: cytochrome b [Geminicoccaceae bacterium]
MSRHQSQSYGAVAQALHWAIAVMIIVQFGLGYYMEDLPRGPQKLELYDLHSSLGITILALAVVRLLWRLAHPAPPLPAHMPAWERTAAQVTHGLIYALILVQPVIGLLQSSAADAPVMVWDLIPLPAVIGSDEALGEWLAGLHTIVGNVLAVLILLHIGAALRHHFLLKDDVLRRMLPGRSSAT